MIHRVDVLGEGLPVVASLTKRLPIILVPEKSGVSTVRCDVVYSSCFRVSALLHTLGAERMGLQIRLADFLPLPCVAPLSSRARHFRMQRQVLLTVECSGFNQLRASGVSAWHLRFEWHISSSFLNLSVIK